MGKKENETSKSFRLSISLAALNDFDEITDCIAYVNGQPLNAIKVGDAIFKAMDKIRENPLFTKSAKQFLQKLKSIARLFACHG
jgi:hypothetical protein